MRDKENKLGAGVIGLGVGEQHALTYAGLGGCDLRWLFDISEDQARAVQGRVGMGDIAESFEQILGDEETGLVSIATFDHLHFEEVMAAFGAGKNVFVEKPLCRTHEELAALKQAWETAGKPYLQSNLVLRQAPVYRWLEQALADGRLGKVYAFDGDYLYGRLEKITEGWRKDVPDYSVMEGGGVHLIDLMMWFLGERPTQVTTHGNRIATEGTDFRYDDFMASTFEFPSGAIGRITANFGCMHRHHHVIRVFGTEATFIYDDQGPRLHETRNEDGAAEMLDLETLPAHKGVLIPDFVDNILNSGDAEAPAEREFDLISVIAAADEALDASGPVEIGYVT